MREFFKRYSFKYVLLLLMFIYVSDDTVLFGTNANSLFVNIKYIYIIAVTGILFGLYLIKTHTMEKKVFCFMAVLMLMLMASMFINNDIRIGYFYKIILLLYAFCISQLLSMEDFAAIFNKIMVLLALVSIIGFLIKYIFPAAFALAPEVTNSANNTFSNLFIFVTPTSFYSGFVRNYGIFREPGVYQMYLILAILLQIYVLKDNNLRRIIIFVIAVITTMSTTGYIALAIVLCGIIVGGDTLSNAKKGFLLTLLCVGFIVLATTTSIFSLSADTQYNSVFAKLVNTDRSTTVARLASITENLRIFSKSPVFGVGLQNLEDLYPKYSGIHYGYATTHNTNTLLIQFAAHGIVYGILWIVGLWKFSCKINYKFRILIFLVVLVLLLGENLSFSGFASVILMYGITIRRDYIDGNEKSAIHKSW